jgi:hypothetical protein
MKPLTISVLTISDNQVGMEPLSKMLPVSAIIILIENDTVGPVAPVFFQ